MSQIRYKGGKREDLDNVYFRSSTEANQARYFKFLKIKFQYEQKTFLFPGIRKGTVSYTPDFYLPSEDRWVEVKGFMDPKSKTKLKRFKKYYPDEFKKLTIIIRDPWSEGKSSVETMNFLDKLGVPRLE